MDELGLRVRQARDQAGLTQEQLARAVGIGRMALNAIEQGADPKASTAVKLCLVLSEYLPEHDPNWLLGLPPGKVADVQRRGFLQRAAAIVPGTLAYQMIATLERRHASAGLDDALLDYWQGLTEQLAAGRPIQPPHELLPQIEMHLSTLYLRKDAPAPERQQRRLRSLIASTAAMTAWVSIMALRPAETNEYLGLAEKFARKASDTDVLALVLMLRADSVSSVKAGGQHGLPHQARVYLAEAMKQLSPSTPGTIAGPVILRTAEEQAAAGNELEARRLTERGRDVLATSPVQAHYVRRELPPWLPESFEGSIFQLLGQPHRAIQALESFSSPFPAHRPLLAADLASAYAQLDDPESASVILGGALAEAADRRHLEGVNRIAGVRATRLGRWANQPAVKRLDEQLSAVR